MAPRTNAIFDEVSPYLVPRTTPPLHQQNTLNNLDESQNSIWQK
jgi:hypothetical protein